MTLDLCDLAAAMRASPTPLSGIVAGYSTDSRSLRPGDLFYALRGPTHDGHDHVAGALAAGAVAAVVDHPLPAAPLLSVADVLVALQDAARLARQRLEGPLVAVTGSAGKTTTKDVIASLLSVALPVGKTEGNYNNHIGLPLSLLRLPDHCRAAVIELGMNHAGEIRALAAVARPDMGVVTNVGHAHIEHFASIDGIALAKRELVEGLGRNGTAVLNADDPRVAAFADVHPGTTLTFGLAEHADVRAEAVQPLGGGSRFLIDGVAFETALAGSHGVRNVLAGVAVARLFGIPLARLAEAARSLAPGRMRGERIERDGMILLNDSYNANPDAMRAMLDVLRDTPATRRIAVLGEMRELGTWSQSLHRQVGECAAQTGVDALVAVRGDALSMVDGAVAAGLPASHAHFVDDPEAAGDLLRSLAHPGDAILFKGSRGTHIELALERFLA